MTVAIDLRSSAVPLNRLLYAFYLTGFLFVGGGFVLVTSGADLRLASEPGAGSALSQTILAFFYCSGSLLLLGNRNMTPVLTRAWPILLLPLLAMLSTVWSPDPLLSLRRAGAFAGTTVFGLSLGAAYARRDLIALIGRGLSLACVLSCAMVVVYPLYGVHQPGDAIQAIHAGAWRGIFGHRNTLGLWAGVAFAVVLVFGRDCFSHLTTRGVALLAAVACLVGARSSTGFVIAAVMTALSLVLLAFCRQSPAHKGIFALIVALAAVVLLLLRDEIAAWALHLLDRDSDLTGRTLLWYFILQIVEKTPSLFGSGYFTGFFTLDSEVSALLQTSFGSAHNGYLETFIYLGYAGLAVCVAVVAWLIFCAARHMLTMHVHEPRPAVFPLAVISIIVIHNFVETTIILPNNLNALLAAALAGMLVLAKQPSQTTPFS
ncbi:MAG TPA: O-antigen ligase family protein [Pseudolabrys sp.]|nr:O-antigen ligase family protein [Pseudolabrys sp.]